METLSMSEHFLQGINRVDFKTRGASALGSIAETKEHLSYPRPGRVSIMARATTNYQDTYHKRPADLMRHQMKMQLLKQHADQGIMSQQAMGGTFTSARMSNLGVGGGPQLKSLPHTELNSQRLAQNQMSTLPNHLQIRPDYHDLNM
jgi:hypothetical protein